jgi:hypothetical protein
LSGSEGTGRLVVHAQGASIDVTDAYLRPVSGGSTHGELAIDVPAGAYRVNARISANETTETVVVRAGQTRELTIEVTFDAAAPVVGTATSDQSHGLLAEELTALSSPAGPSRFVLVLRGLRERSMAPLVEAPTLHDSAGREVELPEPQAEAEGAANRVLGWSVALEPGGYRLSWPPGSGLAVEQSVWLSAGWQTVLFVPQGPQGPIPSASSMHLVAQGQRWEPGAADTLAVELAYARMRGRPTRLTEAEWRSHLASPSPALALLTLHELLRSAPSARPDPARDALMVETAQRLRRELGEHPDVLAVVATLVPEDTSIFVPWPPMLCTSIELVLEADRTAPTVVPDGSFTEETSGQRFTSAPWMLWDPVGTGTAEIATSRVHALTSEVGSRLSLTQEDAGDHLGAEEIGRRLGMTTRLAEKCLTSLREPAQE